MDLYRFDLARHKGSVEHWIANYGTGPFYAIRYYETRFGKRCDVKSIQSGEIHANWGGPATWGILDPFLTAASEAIEQHETKENKD